MYCTPIRQSRSWTIRSCHVTTLEKMKSNRKKRLMILLLKSQVLGNSFIFIVLGLLANLLSVAVLWKQRKMFIYKLFLVISFADLVVSFLACIQCRVLEFPLWLRYAEFLSLPFVPFMYVSVMRGKSASDQLAQRNLFCKIHCM